MNVNYLIKAAGECGQGIFAAEDITPGTRVWTYLLGENVFEYDADQCRDYLQQLPTLADQQRFLDCAFGKGGVLCLITDDGQYMNHADAPGCNCKTDLISGHCYAIRNIAAGEQLFEDYHSFSHPPFLFALLKQYQCEPTYYEMPAEPIFT